MSTPARRRHYRVPIDQSVELSVVVLRGDQVSKSFPVRDASAGGLAFILGVGELPWVGPGDELPLEIRLPDRPQPLRVRGSVLRREGLTAADVAPGAPAEGLVARLLGSARAASGGARGELIAVKFMDSEAFHTGLDQVSWKYFNRRAHRRGDLTTERLMIRALHQSCSRRLDLIDLSLGGLSMNWTPHAWTPSPGERFRLGFVLEPGEGPMAFEATFVHLTPRGSRFKAGLAFDPRRSPRFHSHSVPIGRILVRRELRSAGP